MKNKSKFGILFITSGWFRSIGLQTGESPLSAEVEKIGKEIVAKLSGFIEPVYSGVIFSESSARSAAGEIKKADVCGMIISPLMWCEDQILRAALAELPTLPIILCTFIPTTTLPEYLNYSGMLKGSGSVGTLQLSGFFKREGYSYQSVTGYFKDHTVYETIQNYCLALEVKHQLKGAICGVLPFPCNQMSTTYVDEFNIRKLYGVEYKYLEMYRLYTLAQESSADEIKNVQKKILNLGYEIEIDEKNLEEGIKYALAMEKIIRQENIDIFCMNDVIHEMHSLIGLRPSLYNPDISETRAVVAMEADIAAGIGMFILKRFTNQIPFYSEILNIDLKKNGIILGHAGYHEVVNYDENYPVRIVPDIEYRNFDRFSGAVSCFKYKPGDVTIVNSVYNGERLRFTVIEGKSDPTPPILEDTSHLFCRLNLPVSELLNNFLNLGISQHFLVIPGSRAENLERLCQFVDIEFIKF